jgi:hypothetical protein
MTKIQTKNNVETTLCACWEELEYLFFLLRKAQFFFSEFNIRFRLYNKKSESEYFFQQHWESEYFFRKKHNVPPLSQVKLSFPKR